MAVSGRTAISTILRFRIDHLVKGGGRPAWTAAWQNDVGCAPRTNTAEPKRTMTNDDRLSPQSMEALRARFQEQSRRAQAYYTVMHRARSITGNDDAASAWMNEPLPGFDGKTPSQLVNAGREEDVLAWLDSMNR